MGREANMRRVAWVGLVVGAMLLAAGCGGGNEHVGDGGTAPTR